MKCACGLFLHCYIQNLGQFLAIVAVGNIYCETTQILLVHLYILYEENMHLLQLLRTLLNH